MLQILPTPVDHKAGELGVVATKALWFDLLNPTGAEVTNVEKTLGATLPSLGALSEIEASSRLRNDRGVLYMSTPSAAGRPAGAQTTPSTRVRAVDRSADHRPLHAAAVLRRRRR
jgi:magnesium transporter